MTRCASALLMGCSSGRLLRKGEYEPAGALLAYLAAGCPAAIANLWDVTDRDIDRFAQKVLQTWLERGGPAGAGEGAGECGVGGPVFFGDPISAARKTCKLGHMIGAAPVCYGLPASLRARWSP